LKTIDPCKKTKTLLLSPESPNNQNCLKDKCLKALKDGCDEKKNVF